MALTQGPLARLAAEPILMESQRNRLMDLLKLSSGNGKLPKSTLTFSLLAGKTCPGANICKSWVIQDENNRNRILDGSEMQFRCFAASNEVSYPNTYKAHKHNTELIVEALRVSVDHCADLIHHSIDENAMRKTDKVRIHPSGDFFNYSYISAWYKVAERNPDLQFYCYSKSLNLFFPDADAKTFPPNFYLTASYGGKYDYLIEEGFFPRYAKVVKNDEEASALGLEVDHDDSHCFGDNPFALLVHGIQPAGSEWGAAIRDRKAKGQFVGYGSK